MSLSLQQTQAITDLADHLYGFLPGNPHPFADQTVSFAGIAESLGLGEFWDGGSKLPAITQLLLRTLERRPERFCTLLLAVVRKGIIYRARKDPVTREDIESLNAAIARVGFKIKELWDPGWLQSLPSRPPVRKQAQAVQATAVSAERLAELGSALKALAVLDPTNRGLCFEKFLNDLFAEHDLAPRGAFRLKGEQIDGSFQLGGDTYLVEAKWQNAKIGQNELLIFSGKVSGKAHWSRGTFISLSGFTDDGLEAFARGKQTNIICFNGLDLYHILGGAVTLTAVIVAKARRAAEANIAFAPVRTLFSGVL
jgi:hypothetical protein